MTPMLYWFLYSALCGFVTGMCGHKFPSLTYWALNLLCLGAFLLGRYCK
jgi:hypothetical protein